MVRFLRNPPEVSRAGLVCVGIPTGGLLLSEGLLAIGRSSLALWGYMLVVVVCTLFPLISREFEAVFLSFLLLPVFRLVNLTAPVFVELTLYWLLALYAPFVVAGVYVSSLRETTLIGEPRTTLVWITISITGGAALGELEFSVSPVTFLLPEATTTGLGILAGTVLVGVVAEEFLFRGILQQTIANRVHTGVAVAVSAGVYAAMQPPHTPSAIGVGLVAGLAYAVSYAYSRSLLVPIAFHVTTDLLLFVALPIYGSILNVG